LALPAGDSSDAPCDAEKPMLERELTYQLSFERLAKLSRSAGRKAFQTVFVLTWLWVLVLLVAVIAIVVYADALRTSIQPFGIAAGPELMFLAAAVIFFTGSRWLRKLRVAQLKRRATFNGTIRLTQDAGGLRFSTDEVEHYLKWKGISQVILERDGVAVSHGSLFFLVPDAAFASGEERLAFIRDVYGRLGEHAQAISRKYVGRTLEEAERTTPRASP
jgi:hypothetical protein